MEHASTPLEIGNQIWEIDLLEQNQPGRTAGFILRDSLNVIIETGSSRSIGQIIQGLHALNIPRDELNYIIVTHIHLDHAGGAGTLAKLCPNAKIVVHPRGARHLIDPSRLISGAKAVYGDLLEEYFGQILAVPEDRVLVMNDGDTLTLGANRTLTFLDTPGHAKHHFSIFDSLTKSMFTGDTTGIRYVHAYTGWNFEFVLPTTSPSDFDPQAVHASIAKMKQFPVQRIIHTHFGSSPDPEDVYQTIDHAADAFAAIAEEYYTEGMDWTIMAGHLEQWIRRHLQSLGHSVDDLSPLALDLEVNSKGLIYYVEKKRKESGKSN
ncbi:MBL fold metallo-hydrolase [Fodinisporobacter ferrooxydans]|uniref:MBL fold metallo-hydrolase n=1 Tax=Fodinisporobacter ferrooxydans TaxID=2901836 RepID=A0ABY4CMR6_9BACL|nr:MBL fold metallo-hydrolase [Alicyclobacillaceae bacterium MYW30-H2]